ncbi:MAG TPA: sensor histidine kinase, partial [Acidimicrobiales bacterium]|nr:sensor histidine kinase [Acidimicrobiales bacterium]
LFGELRALIFELRPPALEAEGLAATVRKHLDVVGRAHGLAVEVSTGGEGPLPVVVERELFRIVQEAVTNAVRHAQASSLAVTIEVGADAATVTIRDDGVGFDPGARLIRSRRLGLTSMRERAHALGGRLVIESAPGAGTEVRAEVPVG